jgi:HK97 family phage prohead protease
VGSTTTRSASLPATSSSSAATPRCSTSSLPDRRRARGGGFNERVDRARSTRRWPANPDVHFLINHEGRSLARTKSGTLKLITDKLGLLSEARIDRRTRDGADLEISMERGDLDEMSFAFRTSGTMVRKRELRTLLEVNLDKGDVSVVNNGANPSTRIRIADVRSALRPSATDPRRGPRPGEPARGAARGAYPLNEPHP